MGVASRRGRGLSLQNAPPRRARRHRGAQSVALGPAASPSWVPQGWLQPPPRSSSPGSARSPVQARGRHAGQVRAPTRQGSDLAAAAPQPQEHTRRDQAWAGGQGPPKPQPKPGCSEPVLPDGLRPGLGSGQDVQWGNLTFGAWALRCLPCTLLTACWSHRARRLPCAHCCDGSRRSPPRRGRGLGPGLCPQRLLGRWGRSSRGLRAAVVPSLRLWPLQPRGRRTPGALQVRWGEGRSQEPGRTTVCRGVAGPQLRALPASPPWGTGLSPSWRGGRSLGKCGSGRGCRLVSRRALPNSGWDPGSLERMGRWRRVISGVRPEPLSQGNACSWPEAWWAGRHKDSFLLRPVTTTGDRADVGAADEGDRPGALGAVRGMAAAAVGGAGRLGEKQPLEGIAETGMKSQREKSAKWRLFQRPSGQPAGVRRTGASRRDRRRSDQGSAPPPHLPPWPSSQSCRPIQPQDSGCPNGRAPCRPLTCLHAVPPEWPGVVRGSGQVEQTLE